GRLQESGWRGRAWPGTPQGFEWRTARNKIASQTLPGEHDAANAGDAVSPQRGSANSAVLASFLGWTLDAFDFFLVVMTLTAIGKAFGVSDAKMATTLAVTLAFRPVG